MATKEGVREQLAETWRHFEMVAERLRANIRHVAEGHQIPVEGQARIMDGMARLGRERRAVIYDQALLRGTGPEDPDPRGGLRLPSGPDDRGPMAPHLCDGSWRHAGREAVRGRIWLL